MGGGTLPGGGTLNARAVAASQPMDSPLLFFIFWPPPPDEKLDPPLGPISITMVFKTVALCFLGFFKVIS